MILSMGWQATITVYATLLGASLGAVYDIIRLSRALAGVRYSDRFSRRLARISLPLIGCLPEKEAPHRKRREMAINLFVAVGDVAFFLVASVAVPVFLYHTNNGILRWYLAAGMLLGFWLYRSTFGRLTVLISEPFSFVARALGAYLHYFLVLPLYKALRWLAGRIGILFAKVMRFLALVAMEKYTKKIENTIEKIPDIV